MTHTYRIANHHPKAGYRLFALAAILLALACTNDLFAQRFQSIYGGPNCHEQGIGGARQLVGGGYIACGASFSTGVGPNPCAAPHSYVIKTDAAGAVVWANTYPMGIIDSATEVIEANNGDIVVCGTAHSMVTGRDMYLLRLDANGNVLNTYTLDLGGDEDAWDVVETTTGNFAVTNPGDLVMVGSTNTGVGTGAGRDAIIVRTTANLVTVWQSQFGGLTSNDEYLLGVDECTLGVPPGMTGDIVAVGGTNTPALQLRGIGNGDILVLRVSGLTGGIGGPPQRAVAWGYDQFDEGSSIQELAAAGTPGDLVITGKTLSRMYPSINYEAHVLQLQFDPAMPSRGDVIFGDNGIGNDGGWSVREDPHAGVPGGAIIVAGNTIVGAPPTLFNQNAFLQRFTSTTLLPLGSVVYGDAGHDWAMAMNVCNNISLTETPGYVLVGTTMSTNLLTPGDAADLYMVKTDVAPAPSSSCYEGGSGFNIIGPTFVSQTLTNPIVGLTFANQQPQVSPTALTTTTQLCYQPFRAREEGGGNDGVSGVETESAGDMKLSVHPNPAARGEEISVSFSMATAGSATVVVTDITGREVFRSDARYAAGANELRVETGAWPRGSYVVSVQQGGRRTATPMVLAR